MQNSIEKFSSLLFYFGYSVIVCASIISTSTFNVNPVVGTATKSAIMFSLALFSLNFLTKKYAIQEFIFILMALIVVIISWQKADNNILLVAVVPILFSRGIDGQALNKLYFFLGCALMLVIVAAAIKGIIPNYQYSRGTSIRNSFGIVYPTDFASHIFYLICSYIYLRKEKYGLKDVVILTCISFVVFVKTDARLNFVCTMLVIFLMLLAKNQRIKQLSRYVWILPSALLAIIYLLTKFFDPSSQSMTLLNHLLSNRLSIVNSMMSEYSLTAFGNKILQNGFGGAFGQNFDSSLNTYLYIDSSYLRLMMMFGILTTILLMWGLTWALKKVSDQEFLLIIAVILISGLVEQHMIEIAYNPFFIILATLYFKTRSAEKLKNGV